MRPTKTCGKCQGRMQQGHLIDEGYGAVHVAKWQPGEPRKAWWGSIKVDKKAVREVETHRCDRCGLLEFYAP
ncbi:hypothetical protein [Erythrobacter rubeus]|uniref:Uncharacterized protein n=1 Tax=Erythrobacter rubeus TaxID=2760803 RepID=A0ABR8KU67_9SPHN|nr:hypothetical protein [Erythrobacter rubeus]MBD2842773.1 hypothetical protein [Erythrobacter rubeus]